MFLDLASIVGGLALLTWGADRFVLGASGTARNLGVAPILIGLTVVGFATSAPEMLIAIAAALRENSALAVGNGLGSNTANIGLVLGGAALVSPIAVSRCAVRRELPLLLAVTALASWMFVDGQLTRAEGSMLLGVLLIVLGWLGWLARRPAATGAALDALVDPQPPRRVATPIALAWLAAGLAALLVGARMTVVGAEALAGALGVSDLVIGLTVVAVGTSLPELAITAASILKGEHGLALGNIIGSNVFNLLAVIGAAALIHPSPMEPGVLTLHFPVMAGLTLAFCLMAYNWAGDARITRLKGATLLIVFFAYHGHLFIQST